MTKKQLRQIQVLGLIAVSLVYAGIRYLPAVKNTVSVPDGQNGFYYVERVVDGDTLKLSGGERVRLIGVDTPEIHYSEKLIRDAKKSGKGVEAIQLLGKKASEFTNELCAGKRVRLEFDVKKRDRYGRLLAYMYLEDGVFVNARILEEGYGKVMTVPPNVRFSERFLQLERKAQEERKGLWGISDGK